MRPETRDDFTEPVDVTLRILCSKADCRHRAATGYCCVGDPQLEWVHVERKEHLYACRSFDRSK